MRGFGEAGECDWVAVAAGLELLNAAAHNADASFLVSTCLVPLFPAALRPVHSLDSPTAFIDGALRPLPAVLTLTCNYDCRTKLHFQGRATVTLTCSSLTDLVPSFGERSKSI